jgi:hypothetical protein
MGIGENPSVNVGNSWAGITRMGKGSHRGHGGHRGGDGDWGENPSVNGGNSWAGITPMGESIAQRSRRSQRWDGGIGCESFSVNTGDVAGNRCLGSLFQFSGLVHSSLLVLTGFQFGPLRTFIGRLTGRADVDESIERVEPERGAHRSGQRRQEPSDDSAPPVPREVTAFGTRPTQRHVQACQVSRRCFE